jgi:hypothetical protein
MPASPPPTRLRARVKWRSQALPTEMCFGLSLVNGDSIPSQPSVGTVSRRLCTPGGTAAARRRGAWIDGGPAVLVSQFRRPPEAATPLKEWAADGNEDYGLGGKGP